MFLTPSVHIHHGYDENIANLCTSLVRRLLFPINHAPIVHSLDIATDPGPCELFYTFFVRPFGGLLFFALHHFRGLSIDISVVKVKV